MSDTLEERIREALRSAHGCDCSRCDMISATLDTTAPRLARLIDALWLSEAAFREEFYNVAIAALLEDAEFATVGRTANSSPRSRKDKMTMEDDLCVYCQCEGGHMPDCPTKLERRIAALVEVNKSLADDNDALEKQLAGPTLPEEPSEAATMAAQQVLAPDRIGNDVTIHLSTGLVKDALRTAYRAERRAEEEKDG